MCLKTHVQTWHINQSPAFVHELGFPTQFPFKLPIGNTSTVSESLGTMPNNMHMLSMQLLHMQLSCMHLKLSMSPIPHRSFKFKLSIQKNSYTTINLTNIPKTCHNRNLHLQIPQIQIMTKKKSTPRFHKKKQCTIFRTPRKPSSAATNIMPSNTKQKNSRLARDVAWSI